MEQTADTAVKDPRDKWIPWYFIAFFVVIAILDGIFVYLAVSTQTGVVTERPYEKGLAYNEILDKAATQPDLEHKPGYKDGVFRWELPMENATVTASFIRPVQDGYDFEIALTHSGGGTYESKTAMPLPGMWTAKLKAQWDKNKEFQTTHQFLAE